MGIMQKIKEFLFGLDDIYEDTSGTSGIYEDASGPTATRSGTMTYTVGSTDSKEPAKSKGVTSTEDKIELFKSPANSKWYFRLKASNGKIVAQSEGYSNPRNARKGIEAVRRIAAKAKVEER